MGELTDKLREYSKSNFYPFHMPGHKRNIEALPNPYGYDITEIEDFDDLHEAEDVLDRLTKRFEEIYGAKKAYILVNGSTGGLHTAISAVTEKGDSILIARNSHKSVYNGVFLKELKCDYIYPQINEKTGINQAITAENVDKCLSENPLIKAVLITSPTYEGVVSDIKSIAKVVHGYNIPLIVDAAHGAHFGCGDFFPDNAVEAGADIVVMSLHKTLPALTQTGVMCVNGDIVNYDKIKKYYDIYTTSSPSYLFMSSVELCADYMTEEEERFNVYYRRLVKFYDECRITKLEFVKTDDIGKIVVSTANTNINGRELAQMVRDRWQLEPEMVSAEYVIFMTSVCDSEEGFMRLKTALEDIDSDIELMEKNTLYRCDRPEFFCKINEAEQYGTRVVNIDETEGLVSYDFIYAYPPGIPIVAPGEIINSGIIELLKEYDRAGVKLCGITSDMKVRVCITEG